MMQKFTATAERDGQWWVVQCVEHPEALSQVKRLDRAEEAQREAIAFVTGIPEDEISVAIHPVVDDDVWDRLTAAREHRETADHFSGLASDEIRKVVRTLVDDGYSLRDVGAIAGISYQRVGQLAAGSRD